MSIEERAVWKPPRGSIQKALLLPTVSRSCVVHMSLTERDVAPVTFDYTSRELGSISSPISSSSLQLGKCSSTHQPHPCPDVSTLVMDDPCLPFSYSAFLHPVLYLKAFGMARWGKSVRYPVLQPEFYPWALCHERRALTYTWVPEHACCCTHK